MSLERVKAHLKPFGLEDAIQLFDVSSATVELAAQALGVEEDRICKTLSLKTPEKVLLILFSGNARLDNRKYKDTFKAKAKFLSPEECDDILGHAIGGVCPFGLLNQVDVYLDESLKKHETVFPACGTANSAIELTPEKLYEVSKAVGWVDVSKE